LPSVSKSFTEPTSGGVAPKTRPPLPAVGSGRMSVFFAGPLIGLLLTM
jgi:hypothetical protein